MHSRPNYKDRIRLWWAQISVFIHRNLGLDFINKFTYSPFHKTLPRSRLQTHMISVRFYEMGYTLCNITATIQNQSPGAWQEARSWNHIWNILKGRDICMCVCEHIMKNWIYRMLMLKASRVSTFAPLFNLKLKFILIITLKNFM